MQRPQVLVGEEVAVPRRVRGSVGVRPRGPHSQPRTVAQSFATRERTSVSIFADKTGSDEST
ncbi:MAG: hypothetical protein QOF01_898 [Thermomicrobiales bacterium]|nr:hypothetical protein [Thermomicrobiales bacterium]